jgi:spore maturation protein SpmA
MPRRKPVELALGLVGAMSLFMGLMQVAQGRWALAADRER